MRSEVSLMSDLIAIKLISIWYLQSTEIANQIYDTKWNELQISENRKIYRSVKTMILTSILRANYELNLTAAGYAKFTHETFTTVSQN